MRYACLIYEGNDPNAEMSPEEQQSMRDGYAAFTKDVSERGVMLGGEPLQPPMTATTVRVADDGDVLTTDGPFAETKEWLAGFYLIEAHDLDEAIELGAKIPSAKHGSIEVRPIMELPPDYPRPS